ncbi:MAG: hypothetical protein HQM13_07145 [SAR324 cluster bacterium]|nr:hypothetical protein [SAR324 cluster bacterium]
MKYRKFVQLFIQVLAVLIALGFWAILFHKGNADIATIYRDHPDDFWKALGQYLITNLAR